MAHGDEQMFMPSHQKLEPLAGEDNMHSNDKLVRLNTAFREQLHEEGWEGTMADGFLTEDELINAARVQGLLKRRARNWKIAAMLGMAWLLLSCSTILAAVWLAAGIVQDTHVDSETGSLLTKDSDNPVQVAAGTVTIDLKQWQTVDPVYLLNLDRVVSVPANGSLLGMLVASVVTDYKLGVLVLKTSSGGSIVVHNTTIQSIDIAQENIPLVVKNSRLGKKLLTSSLTSISSTPGFVATPAKSLKPMLRQGKCYVNDPTCL
eukprot:jgi/Mesen1/7438/ME000388S06651